MTLDLQLWNSFLMIVGQVTIVAILIILLLGVLLVSLTIYSIRRGAPVFPKFLKAGIALLEGFIKALFRLFGLEDQEVLTFLIQLQNSMNLKAFSAIPPTERAIFLPQCLRSARCPAHLAPEGLKCRSCGQCSVGQIRVVLEQLGYRVFIVPGSSFIKRMVKKYRPKAIIGVGCLTEVKDGLEMADRLGLTAMGIVTLKDGCVETLVSWDDLFDVAFLGIDPATFPPELPDLLASIRGEQPPDPGTD